MKKNKTIALSVLASLLFSTSISATQGMFSKVAENIILSMNKNVSDWTPYISKTQYKNDATFSFSGYNTSGNFSNDDLSTHDKNVTSSSLLFGIENLIAINQNLKIRFEAELGGGRSYHAQFTTGGFPGPPGPYTTNYITNYFQKQNEINFWADYRVGGSPIKLFAGYGFVFYSRSASTTDGIVSGSTNGTIDSHKGIYGAGGAIEFFPGLQAILSARRSTIDDLNLSLFTKSNGLSAGNYVIKQRDMTEKTIGLNIDFITLVKNFEHRKLN